MFQLRGGTPESCVRGKGRMETGKLEKEGASGRRGAPVDHGLVLCVVVDFTLALISYLN